MFSIGSSVQVIHNGLWLNGEIVEIDKENFTINIGNETFLTFNEGNTSFSLYFQNKF